MKNVALHNLGCKVNAYETESMMQQLEQSGYRIVPFAPGADIYIINTCTVTNIADRKSRQMLHKAKKMNPDAVVVAAGCYVQTAAEQGKKDEAIDLVIGNNKKKDIIQVLDAYFKNQDPGDALIDINQAREYEALSLEKAAEHTRAYIKVQDGCNQFCSYCIIPYARGRVRSRARAEVIEEVARLAGNGCQEVVLTGIHLSSYGVDFENGENLLDLIEAVHKVKALKRIRLGSLEPRIITEEFCRRLAGMDKVCPHFHLSLQSGCEKTLIRMNRRYTASEYYNKCQLLRKYFSHPALTTDIIVGFPGEGETEFAESRDFISKVKFFETHIFKYSRRQGTKAAAMPDQVSEQVKASRSQVLQELNQKNKEAWLTHYIGHEVEILVEESTVIEGERYYTGHTREYIKTIVKSRENLENRLIRANVTDIMKNDCVFCEIM